MTRKRSKNIAKIAAVLFPVAVLNFVVFALVAVALGGSAALGHSGGGHYFVSNHGRLTEVSSTTFIYSLIHTYFSFALILLCIVLAGVSRRRPARTSRPQPRPL